MREVYAPPTPTYSRRTLCASSFLSFSALRKSLFLFDQDWVDCDTEFDPERCVQFFTGMIMDFCAQQRGEYLCTSC